MFGDVLYTARVFCLLKDHLKCKNGHDLSLCNSHGMPSLIKILLDGHTVITTERQPFASQITFNSMNVEDNCRGIRSQRCFLAATN